MKSVFVFLDLVVFLGVLVFVFLCDFGGSVVCFLIRLVLCGLGKFGVFVWGDVGLELEVEDGMEMMEVVEDLEGFVEMFSVGLDDFVDDFIDGMLYLCVVECLVLGEEVGEVGMLGFNVFVVFIFMKDCNND